MSYGGDKWGNFIEVDAQNSGRFLDPPEFAVFHDKGNELNMFDRIDRQLDEKDSVRLNVNVSRSWFQTPNTFDNVGVQNVISGGSGAAPVFGGVGNTDQRSKILTYNVAPTYTRTVSAFSVFNFGVYVRRDDYNYYPSKNPLADLGPIQQESISQSRSLTNTGLHTDYSYIRGIHNLKAGVQYTQTFLREHDNLGLIDSTFNSPCVDAGGNSLPGFLSPTQCAAKGDVSNSVAAGGTFNPVLLPYDLTRGGTLFSYFGHTDVKELALYLQDQIKVGAWLFNTGVRFDRYNGLAKASQIEPRVGMSYTIKKTGRCFAHRMRAPWSLRSTENLVLSSQGCGSAALAPLLQCTPGVSTTLQPGFRNEFHAGLQQGFTKHLVFSGDYIWKYTHNAFDFSVLGNTPITFPIDWHNSKIPGFALRTDMPNWRGFSAFNVMSSGRRGSFRGRWRRGCDRGAGQHLSVPHRSRREVQPDDACAVHTAGQACAVDGLQLALRQRPDGRCGAVLQRRRSEQPVPGRLDSDQRQAGDRSERGLRRTSSLEAGLACNGVKATPSAGIPNSQCLASQITSNLLSIPAPNTEDDDRNPPRIKPRNVFDMSVGTDNLWGSKEKHFSLQLTAVNITNKIALYNFLSTFSGTHYLTAARSECRAWVPLLIGSPMSPRALTRGAWGFPFVPVR